MTSERADDGTLRFPSEIADIIGLSPNAIGLLKKRGCPFHGRKTTVRWVREFIGRQVGAEAPRDSSPSGHPPRSSASKSYAQVGWND